MKYNFEIEQARNGKIAATGPGRTVMLNLDQVIGLCIDVQSLDNFDKKAYQNAYLLEDTINAGLPAPRPGRYAFLRDLLEQRMNMLQSPRRDAEISLLREMLDELPKEWMGHDYRPAQKYVGQITTISGDADFVVFETTAGQRLLLTVSAVASLRKFLLDDEDAVWAYRKEHNVNANLVASVRDTTLVALEWQVPWGESDTAGWRLLDQKNLRCVRVVHDGEHVYEFVQAKNCLSAEPKYRYANVLVDMKKYTPEEITQALRDNGYMGMADYRSSCGGTIDWLRLAELFVDREVYKVDHRRSHNATFEQVRKKIEEKTGLSLSGTAGQ